jgi:hypothetical protein
VALLPCVAGHGVHHALADRLQKLPRPLQVAVSEQLHGVFEIGKQHRDLLALAFQGGFRDEDFLGEVRGRVGMECLGTWHEGGRGSG